MNFYHSDSDTLSLQWTLGEAFGVCKTVISDPLTLELCCPFHLRGIHWSFYFNLSHCRSRETEESPWYFIFTRVAGTTANKVGRFALSLNLHSLNTFPGFLYFHVGPVKMKKCASSSVFPKRAERLLIKNIKAEILVLLKLLNPEAYLRSIQWKNKNCLKWN